MEKKVYVLIHQENLNAYSDSAVYTTKKVAEQALQEERERLISDYKKWEIKDDNKHKFVLSSFDYAEFVSLHIEEHNLL